ncbi:MAG TPA: hypothetical protein VKW78_18930 [Terriglobales bacterium]|nr:hypothetical protein [Terriglobales bacterium]
MKTFLHQLRGKRTVLSVCLIALLSASAFAADDLSAALAHTRKHVATFLDQFSDVKCTENVQQLRLTKHGKVEYKETSTFDYLLIAQNTADDLDLQESRLAVNTAEHKKSASLLVTNGFAILELIFHPSYQNSFTFTNGGTELMDAKLLMRINFEAVKEGKSPTALLLRGREFPLQLMGTAWVEPDTGVIHRIVATLAEPMTDLGLRTLNTDVHYSPVKFNGDPQVYWFPTDAEIEVETPRQHWRNIHHFTKYQQFNVSTQESVKTQ